VASMEPWPDRAPRHSVERLVGICLQEKEPKHKIINKNPVIVTLLGFIEVNVGRHGGREHPAGRARLSFVAKDGERSLGLLRTRVFKLAKHKI